MADNTEPGLWEDTLDRELDKQGARGQAVMETRSEPDGVPVTSTEPVLDEDGESISVGRLRAEVFHSVTSGMTLAHSIYDESGVLLLAAGSRITQRFLQLLRERGITRVRLRSTPEPQPAPSVSDSPEELAEDDLHTRHSRELDERMADELQRHIETRPIKAWRRPRLSADDLKGEATRGLETHSATSAAVTHVCAALQAGRNISVSELRRSIDHFVDMVTLDFDLLPFIVALQESKDDYLYDHCVNVALLSMAMASQLGLSRPAVMEIGLGGMLQDIGMLRVPDSIRLGSDEELTEREWREVRRHPLHTLDMLADLRGVPLPVKFVGYQVHERLDGYGYPRGRSGRQLHRYAEIVSIADVYTAMTHPRPHRPALLPYVATRRILIDAHRNKFDRELVRAFLDTVSLFPVGSRVRLSDGSTGRILRANPGLHTRPVLEELTADGCPTGHIIDLSDDATLRVIKAT